MHRILLILLLTVAPAAAQDFVVASDRVSSFVRVRSAPSTDSREVGRLEIGAGLALVGEVPRWYEVRLPGGQAGFVSKAWTEVSFGLRARQQDELRIHFLNVGTGTCTIVECPGANAVPMIVDCGSTAVAPASLTASDTRAYVQEILARHEAPPNVVLSHADQDHYSYIPAVLTDPVASVWKGGDPADYGGSSFPQWLAAQERGGAEVKSGFVPHWHNDREPITELACGDASTYVLTVNSGSSRNAQSLVLMIEYQDFTAVLSGDAEGVTEATVTSNFGSALKATVLTASHHGADTQRSNSAAWAAALAPDVLIYSAGRRFNHPRCAAMERFTSVVQTRGHDVQCGDSGGFRPRFRTRGAHYMTEVSGAVIVTTSGRSPMLVNCTQAVDCGVRIAH